MSMIYIPLEAFLYLDKNKCIQNNVGIPIVFHSFRRANVKAILCNQPLPKKTRKIFQILKNIGGICHNAFVFILSDTLNTKKP